MIETFKRVTGRKAVYASAYSPDELVRHFPEFGQNPELVRENIGMAEYAVEYGYFRKDRDLAWSRRINLSSLTWEQFLIKTGWTGDKTAFGLN